MNKRVATTGLQQNIQLVPGQHTLMKVVWVKFESYPRCPTLVHITQIVDACRLLKKIVYLLRNFQGPKENDMRMRSIKLDNIQQ